MTPWVLFGSRSLPSLDVSIPCLPCLPDLELPISERSESLWADDSDEEP